MLKHKIISTAIMGLAMVLFIGCQDSQMPVSPESTPSFDMHTDMDSYPIAASNLISAEFQIYLNQTNNQTVQLFQITEPWEEMTVTWNSFYDAVEPIVEVSPEATFSTSPPVNELRVVDVTSLVEDWLEGESTNHGILLKQKDLSDAFPRAKFDSKEKESENPPKLILTFEGKDPITLIATADTYIRENEGDSNFGADVDLYTGIGKENNTGEKQSLVKFDIAVGCSRTPGYWKTHADEAKKQFDDTWNQLADGPDTDFYLSDQSFIEVLWTEPEGNAYYILAFQYIAAVLNAEAGADVSVIDDVLTWAHNFFTDYTPEEVAEGIEGGPTHEMITEKAEILDAYNNGEIGPGHCDDFEDEEEE